MIERYRRSARSHVHCKDIRPDVLARIGTRSTSRSREAIKAGVFCPIGDGLVDIGAVLAVLDKIGYDGFATIAIRSN